LEIISFDVFPKEICSITDPAGNSGDFGY